MTNLQLSLERACKELRLRTVMPFFLTTTEGVQITAVALLPDLGASKGMIIVENFEDLRGASVELPEMGYGYSVLDEPLPNESFELDSYKETFSDWGWANTNDPKPDWMT